MSSFLRHVHKGRLLSKVIPARLKHSAPSASFMYTSLQDPASHFRLVILHPALEDSDDIKCTLQYADLSNPGEFEALSYAWGDQAEKQTITLNNQKFEVTSNLANALRNLRNLGPHNRLARTFWIDAICIDQRNEIERNAQVRRMDVIYESAREVVVWLGRYSEPEDALGKFEEQYGYEPFPQLTYDTFQKMSLALNRWVTFEANEDGMTFDLNRFIDDDAASLCYFSRICNRAWFHRLWVFQEVSLARKVVLVCGRCTMDMELISEVADSLSRSGMSSVAFDEMPEDPAIHESAWRVQRMFSTTTKKTSLWKLLKETRELKCTDPRDKLIAIHGLMTEDDKEDICIDYTQSIAEMYKGWAKRRMVRTGRLDIFSYCNESNGLDLPSWVPNLSTNSWSFDHTFLLQSDINNKARTGLCYSATGNSFADAMISEDGLQIKLWGHKIGQITSLSASTQSMSLDWNLTLSDSILPKVLKAWEDFVIRNLNLQKLTDLQPEKFLEVLLRGYLGNSKALNPFERWHYTLEKFINSSRAGESAHKTFISTLGPYAYTNLVGAMYSQIFITDTGSIGIVRECCNIAVGDTVHLLLGGNTPYVLRQDSDTQKSHRKGVEQPKAAPELFETPLPYRFMGSCYVQGYMDGEAMPSFRKGEIEFSNITLY
ncbi:heterokaryon incompatibility protein-domain-containing protein [Leptodontidium sp. MPI-SDFR-AT-0119]|nr:heterokaryon incompatibility protein-domain-containing protein [Leptodontidium sp. MPI-SDFR-AT-0119]